MNSRLFADKGILHELTVATKAEAFRKLLEKMCHQGLVPADCIDLALDLLLDREELGPTAIGSGVAIPHARVDFVDRAAAIVGYAPGGIDFNSPDGERVTKVCLVISPASNPGELLRALEHLTRHLRLVSN